MARGNCHVVADPSLGRARQFSDIATPVTHASYRADMRLFRLLLAALVVSVLAACGGTSDDAQSSLEITTVTPSLTLAQTCPEVVELLDEMAATEHDNPDPSDAGEATQDRFAAFGVGVSHLHDRADAGAQQSLQALLQASNDRAIATGAQIAEAESLWSNKLQDYKQRCVGAGVEMR